MNKQLNAHDYESIYKDLDINLNTLGCVMADLEPFDPEFLTEASIALSNNVVVSSDEEQGWINGFTLGENPHITLLYGLLVNAHKWAGHIGYLMENWNMPTIEIESIGSFDSPFEDKPYYCIVAHIKLTDELLDAHARLELLPHINTYSSFKPHLTIAYVKKDDTVRGNAILYFTEKLVGKTFQVKKQLNLGDQ